MCAMFGVETNTVNQRTRSTSWCDAPNEPEERQQPFGFARLSQPCKARQIPFSISTATFSEGLLLDFSQICDSVIAP